MSMDVSNGWEHENLLRNNLYGRAIPVLQKCGLARIASKLCDQFNLQILMDLCKLTDDVIDRTTWLKQVQKQKLKWICAICRDEQEKRDRHDTVETWQSNVHGLRSLLAQLQSGPASPS